MTYFTEQTIELIRKIPPGKVMTYGQIAMIAGNPRGARQVVRILSSMSQKYHLPWHRVVNRLGEVVLNFELDKNHQIELLVAEGIVFQDGKIDLKLFQV